MCVTGRVGPQHRYWESADGMCGSTPAVYAHRRFAMGVLVQGRAEEERSALREKVGGAAVAFFYHVLCISHLLEPCGCSCGGVVMVGYVLLNGLSEALVSNCHRVLRFYDCG